MASYWTGWKGSFEFKMVLDTTGLARGGLARGGLARGVLFKTVLFAADERETTVVWVAGAT